MNSNKKVNSLSNNEEKLKDKTFFRQREILQEEDLTVEFKQYNLNPRNMKKDHEDCIKKTICAFLNQKGGRMYIGVNDQRVVEGVILNDKDKDLLRNYIINLTKYFHPSCRMDKIRVIFMPVKSFTMTDMFIQNCYVIKIIVKQGNPDKLYSITDRSYQSYMRLPGQVVLLRANEIENYIIELNKNPREYTDDSEFNDPEPIQVPSNKLMIIDYKMKETNSSSSNEPIRIEDEEQKEAKQNMSDNDYPSYEEKRRKLQNKENTYFKHEPAKLMVGNLHSNITKEEVISMFKEFALGREPILIHKIGINTYATVPFDNMGEAIKAKSIIQRTYDSKIDVQLILNQ